MVVIENVVDISFNMNTNGIKHLKLIFNKNIYNNEIHIKEKTYKKILANITIQNILEIYNINLNNTYLDIFHNNENYRLMGFLCQKKTLQEIEKYVVFTGTLSSMERKAARYDAVIVES